MIDHRDRRVGNADDAPDPELGARLKSLHAQPTAAEVEALRQRIRIATRAQLATQLSSRDTALGRAASQARLALPCSLAAAALALIVLQQQPAPSRADRVADAVGVSLLTNPEVVIDLAGRAMLPTSADDLLLASPMTSANAK